MPKITAVKAAVKTRGRYNIFIDGLYTFSLDELQVVNAGVRVGKELSEAEITALKDESTFGKAYARALEYIMRRPRSVKELRDYAWRKQWGEPLSERVVNRLIEKGYLNDTKFAEAWVRHRSLGKPISERKLRLELKQKGVADEIINEVLAQSEAFDELAGLRQLVAKKRARYSDEQKFMAFLARQGFGFDAIKQVLSEDI
ncbi:MAG TPA: RecX family transcriptional regulator [Candidatus Saccharimonadales bacterium]